MNDAFLCCDCNIVNGFSFVVLVAGNRERCLHNGALGAVQGRWLLLLDYSNSRTIRNAISVLFRLQVDHKKAYPDEAEDKRRMEIFKANLAKIEAHNELFKKGEVTWEMGLNHFTDLTDEERKMYTGLRQAPPKE